MALGIETTAFVMVAFAATHVHLHKGGEGTLTFSADGIRWEETGKKQDHSRTWKYEDVQKLELAPGRLRISTYDRDRAYSFLDLPEGIAERLYPSLAGRLDQRFVAHVGDPAVKALYEIPAKFLHGRRGANGILKIGADRIVFEAGGHGDSRAWRYADVASISNSSAFELTLNTIEGENRFQLKQRLPEERYQELWRSLSETNGLTIYHHD